MAHQNRIWAGGAAKKMQENPKKNKRSKKNHGDLQRAFFTSERFAKLLENTKKEPNITSGIRWGEQKQEKRNCFFFSFLF
jgi:hypothetical protein